MSTHSFWSLLSFGLCLPLTWGMMGCHRSHFQNSEQLSKQETSSTDEEPVTPKPEEINPAREFWGTAPLSGKELKFQGTLTGHWIRTESGGFKGEFGKTRPLSLRFGPENLALMAVNDDLAQKLVDHALQDAGEVSLTGYMINVPVEGRGTQSPQAGYYGPIPDHRVWFLQVTSVTGVSKVAPPP